MTQLGNLSISQKLTLLMTLTGAIMLALVGAASGTFEYYKSKSRVIADLEAIADVTAANCAADLSLDDPSVADRETLPALKDKPYFQAAILYGTNGSPFASYVSPGITNQFVIPEFRSDGVLQTRDSIGVFRPVLYKEKRQGTIFVQQGIGALRERWSDFAAILAFVFFISIPLVLLISSGLQRLISRPILDLARVTSLIASNKDYGIRLPSRGNTDELGKLVVGFNEMLGEIQERDAALQKARDELEIRVNERTRDLQNEIAEHRETENMLRSAKEAAESANQAKSEFLAVMSHELRTPMNGVLGFTSFLLDSDLNPKQRDFAQTIRASGETLLELLNQVLDFSKIESGRMDLECENFDLVACVEEALDIVSARAAEKGLDLAFEYDPEVPEWIRGDVTRLRQVLVNLLGNAVKFTECGWVLVSVKLTAPAPEANTRLLHFSIQDTGVGIPADKLDRLFQPFSQVDSSTARRYGGTGLGLAICRKLVEALGGQIGVTSKLGEGSTFFFTLTLTPSTEPQTRTNTRIEAAFENRTVLILDARPVGARLLLHQLKVWGMTAHLVPDIEAGQALFQKLDAVDLIIADDAVLAQTPPNLLQSLATERNRSRPPLIVLSRLGADSTSGSNLKDLCRSAVCRACVAKPIHQSILYNTILEIFARSPGYVVIPPPKKELLDATLGTRVPMRVLLVEDNAINQKLGRLALSRLGYSADLAANGIEAVAAFRDRPYDLILMDVQMPEMDGLQATRLIRELEAQPPTRALSHVHIIAMTANAMPGDKAICLSAGMDDYVQKPMRPEALQSALLRSPMAQAVLKPTG
jgi:signal transduction histidine kinase/CheY-like chemotaxis protein